MVSGSAGCIESNERSSKQGARFSDFGLCSGRGHLYRPAPQPRSPCCDIAELADAVAVRIVDLLEQHRGCRRRVGLATVGEVADRLGVSTSWVYANKERLGAIRLGRGPKARLRFDLERATGAVNSAAREEQPRPAAPRARLSLPPGVELIEARRYRAGS